MFNLRPLEPPYDICWHCSTKLNRNGLLPVPVTNTFHRHFCRWRHAFRSVIANLGKISFNLLESQFWWIYSNPIWPRTPLHHTEEYDMILRFMPARAFARDRASRDNMCHGQIICIMDRHHGQHCAQIFELCSTSLLWWLGKWLNNHRRRVQTQKEIHRNNNNQ